MLSAREIRQTFFDFFEEKKHKIVPSAPIVLKNDPTLMFTNAGMNQFKDIFLDNAKAQNTKVANSQKCLRVSGKHNDLEEVGVDTYHHTMFEMLGNWSFADYFKEEAIAWAWELLTKKYKIETSKIYVTIFGGDEEDGTKIDKDALEFWKKHIAPECIIAAGKEDNFWEMGETGPCGPCSEIHIDLRSDEEIAEKSGKYLVNKDHPQVIEVWNLVFIQFERKKDKSLIPLPNKHIDTGMGFERLVRALQNKQSNYDTDVFQPLIIATETIAGKKYGRDEKTDIAFRVIADHIRAVAFTIADGQLPSNTGAGYVIRRVLRRAIRYAYSYLDIKEAFLYSLTTILCEQFDGVFPELAKQKEFVSKIIKEEETQFYKTLDKGIQLFNEEAKKLGDSKTISGNFAFKLYDTFGFPFDLTLLMAKEIGKDVDEKGFNTELKKQKERSKKASALDVFDWTVLKNEINSNFTGYDTTSEQNVSITKYRKVEAKNKTLYQLVLNNTPFYPEGGGQIGDSGILTSESNETLAIFDTKKENGEILHFTANEPTFFNNITANVTIAKRMKTQKNHSATHLLHLALRSVLGTHVEQRGSLVNDSYLRFDFSHFQKVSTEELNKIEKLVNQQIQESLVLQEFRNTPIDKAKEMGAMALFGEKYGNEVRVIKFGDSVELCGGTHIANTAEIGLFKIKSEGSVAAGIRRIEAFTSATAFDFLKAQEEKLSEILNTLKNPKDANTSILNLIAENDKLKKEVSKLQKEKALQLADSLKSSAAVVNGHNIIAQKVDLPSNAIKDLIFELKKQENTLLLLANAEGEKATLSIGVSDDLVKDNSLHAGNIVRTLAKEINGGGGGQPTFATAGGKNPNGIEKAIERMKNLEF